MNYYRIKDIDHLEPAKYERYFGLAVVYTKHLGLINHFNTKTTWEEFKEFIKEHFANTKIKLMNPNYQASGEPLDGDKFKNLVEIVG